MERFVNANEVPVDDIKDTQGLNIKNENCTFNDHAIAGVQYVNIPQDVLDIVLKYNQKLEEEVHLLKTKINQTKNG